MAISARLDADFEERLDRLAKDTGRTKTYYLNKCVERALPEIEYAYALQREYEDYRAGIRNSVTLDELRSDLGLDD